MVHLSIDTCSKPKFAFLHVCIQKENCMYSLLKDMRYCSMIAFVLVYIHGCTKRNAEGEYCVKKFSGILFMFIFLPSSGNYIFKGL